MLVSVDKALLFLGIEVVDISTVTAIIGWGTTTTWLGKVRVC